MIWPQSMWMKARKTKIRDQADEGKETGSDTDEDQTMDEEEDSSLLLLQLTQGNMKGTLTFNFLHQ